ncbi:hypothetical protein FG386_003263 [Cryptosporidium ryanae]|uniref:uncharacterized protein n=1 Tax=Cryptosporidium ryanae TaxID=515981 RepID=UPI00351A0C08|nr:hypothetical protein FG386_003263 [Cryptosporidium ryanae]
MGLEVKLGNYSNIDIQKVSDWLIKHILDRDGTTVITLQFSEYDVEYGPRIQFLIQQKVEEKLKNFVDEDKYKRKEIRYVIISDELNPLCCIDILNIKKSHSNLLLHFGECCYTHIKEISIPLLFIKPDSYFDCFFSNRSKDFSFSESVYELLDTELCKMTREKMSSKHNSNISDPRINNSYDISLIFSFQDAMINEEIRGKLLNLINELKRNRGELVKSISGYILLDIESNEIVVQDGTNLIFNRVVEKLSQDTPELDLVQLESKFNENNNKIMFIHIIPEGISTSGDTNDNSKYSNCLIKRVFLRYNQVFNILVTRLNYTFNNWSLSLYEEYQNDLNKYISRRFVYIERALSIEKVNRVAFMVFPGTTKDEWKLLNFYSRFSSRKDINDNSKVIIESHIILFTSVSEVKLRNFTNIDIYCYFGCPEYFIYHIVNYLNIKLPIILTPYEYEVYLGIREWTPTFLNPSDLVNSVYNFLNKEDFSDESETEYSSYNPINAHLMIDGGKLDSIQANCDTKTTVRYNTDQIQQYYVQGKKLISRLKTIKSNLSNSFYGLDPLENTQVIPNITQGKYGVASKYQNETKNN